MLIDTHAHLDDPQFAADLPAVLERAHAASVEHILTIATTAASSAASVALAGQHSQLSASAGIHPNHVAQAAASDWDEVVALVRAGRVKGIGETGLDYYYDKSDRKVQQALFRTHVAVARATGLPLIIHTREAEADTAAILEDEIGQGTFPALIHCFTASAAFARKVLDMGLTISLSGIVTFKNAKDLQEIAAQLPEDRLLVETDSPFLAPIPHRGRTCEPAYTADTARFVASLRGMTPEALGEATTRNFFALFSKASA